MPASFSDLLQSRSFKFIVGGVEDGALTEFFVHEEAIAQLSPKLKSLMRGGLHESQTACAVWEDVSKETFKRFAQFAYTGDYSIPEGEKRLRKTEESKKGKKGSNVFGETNGSLSEKPESPVFGISPPASPDWAFDAPDAGQPSEPPPPPDDVFFSSSKKSLKAKKKKGIIFEEAALPLDIPENPDPEEPLDFGFFSSSKKFSKGKKKKLASSSLGMPFEEASLPVEVPTPEEPPSTQREVYPEFARVNLTANFNDLNFADALAPRDNYAATTEPSTSFNPELNYSPILLVHAALYFLADYNQVDSLKALSLYKLHKTLCYFVLDNTNICDIIDLVRFSYHKHEGDVGHELRNMICQFMAVHAVELSRGDEFMELLAEGGQFVKDFFRFEVQRDR